MGKIICNYKDENHLKSIQHNDGIMYVTDRHTFQDKD